MRLTDLLALSDVPRWSIVRTVCNQSVSDHTFRVLAILSEIEDRLGRRTSAELLRCALEHDMDESRTGDIPTTAKEDGRVTVRGLAPLRGVSPVDRDLLRLADLVETYTFIEMNGAGLHSMRVATELREKVARLLTVLDDERWSAVVWAVIEDILAERER